MTIRVSGPAADPLALAERAAPAAVADTGKVYVKDVAGRSELFYRDDTGAEVQVTTGGAIVGSAVDTLAATLVAGNTAGGTALLAAPGTEALPGLAHDGDAGTGRRRVSAGVLGWSLAGTERMRLTGQGLVIGGSAPQITTLPALEVQSGVQAFIIATTAGTAGPHIDFYRARGTLAAPTNVASGDVLGIHEFVGRNGVFQTAAAIIGYVDGALGSAIPSRIEFTTSSAGTPGLLALTLNSAQQALHASGTAALPSRAFSAEPGLGSYRSGAGQWAVAVGAVERLRVTADLAQTFGGRRRARATKTTTFTASAAEDVLLLDTTGGAFTGTMPDATAHAGQVFHFRLIAGAATATLARSGTDTIDGATSLLLAQVGDAVSLQADGTTWRVLSDSRRLATTHVLDNASAAVVTAALGAVVVTGSFTSRYGGRLLILASGSLWSGSTGNKTLDLQIDGVVRASKAFSINEINEHHAFAATFTLETGIAAGARTIRWVTADAVTNTDANDRYDLLVVELPY